MNRLLPTVSFSLLTACYSGPYPLSSPYFTIPKGSELVLKQELSIPAEKGRVYIQDGQQLMGRKIEKYNPHCWFVSWVISKDKTVIKPDRFIVLRSKKYDNLVNDKHTVMFASNSAFSTNRSFASITAIEHFTELSIHSDRQNNIRQFVCNHWGDPLDARPLTVAEINNTLGKIAQLIIPVDRLGAP